MCREACLSLFGVIKSDDNVFTGDKIRFDFRQSFLTPDVIFSTTLSHQVSFDAGATYLDVTSNKYIDYMYSTSGSKTVTLKLKTSTAVEQTFTKIITVLDITTAALFSKDHDLYQFEPEIDQYLPKKWSSWNMIHKQAQEWIIDWLDEAAIYKYDGSKFAVADIGDSQQVKQLSIYKVLEIIFEGNSNIVGDLFSIKRDKYKALAQQKMSRANLRLDYDDSGVVDTNERINLVSGTLIRG